MEPDFTILKVSLEIMRKDLENFADSFYKNLFARYPRFQSLFLRTNMREQKKMLMGMILLIADNWNKPLLWMNIVKKLGARHVKYGAKYEYYPIFGEIFLVTLEEFLGSDWTAEVKLAWNEAFDKITEIMLEGSQESEELEIGTNNLRKKFHSKIKQGFFESPT